MRLVVKFGGTSVKTPTLVRRAAGHLARFVGQGHEVLIVVSAMGDATNRLMRLGRDVWPEAQAEEPFLQLLATGEARSAALMALALRGLGVKAEVVGFDHPRFPLVAEGPANGHPLSSVKANDPVEVRLDEEETARRFDTLVEPMLRSRVVPVIPGFFVRGKGGGLVTLGRGGSDVTAFLVGRFCRADEVAIVTDVAGVMTADPRVVAGTSVVPALDAALLSAIALGGARVLHPNALLHKPESLAARVVHFRDLGRLLDGRTGTRIEGSARTRLSLWPEPLAQVLLFAQGLARRPGVLAGLGGFLAERGVSIHSMTQSDNTVALYLETRDAGRILDDLHADFVGTGRPFTELIRNEPVGELTLDNPAFVDTPGVIASVSHALGQARINIIEMVTSHASIIVYCRHEDGERAAAVLRERLGLRKGR